MDGSLAAWLFAISLGASALGGMLGMASGIFIVPILTIFGHVDIHTAIGASLISVIACSCASAAPFLRSRLTNIRLAILLETATSLGALSGVLLIGIVSTRFLFILFGAILLLSAWQMAAKRRDPLVESALQESDRWAGLRLNSSYPDAQLGRDVPYRVQRVHLGMLLMYGAGLVSAILGIGSGVLKVPAMDSALRLPIKVSSATSNFMIGVTGAVSAGAYLMRGDIVCAVAGPVALGSVVGAIAGAKVLVRIPNEKVRILFAAALVALGAQMLRQAWGVRLLGGAR